MSGPNKNLVLKKSWVQKRVRLKQKSKFQRNVGQTIFGSLEIVGPKNVGSEKIWVWKILSPQKFRVKKNLEPEKLPSSVQV